MHSLIQTLHERLSAHPSIAFLTAGLLVILVKAYNQPDLSHIPTIGFSGILSYLDGYRYILRANDILLEGYHKYREYPGFFKTASASRWNVIIASPQMINELRMAKDDEASLNHASEEEVATQYTVGLSASASTYHIDTVRMPLTRNLVSKFDDIYDEIAQSFEDLIAAKDDEWVAVPILPTIQKIVCRTSNRLFLGEPMCRNPEWLDLNIRFTIDVFVSAQLINLFPRFLQPFAGSVLSPINNAMRICRKFFEEEVVRRVEMYAELGTKDDSLPNDLISWLIECAPPGERTVDSILKRVLGVNITAVHTTSNSFYQALLNLATHPEYAAPMREEVSSVVQEYGWTKEALGKMYKVDSFLKESFRFEGQGALTVHRKIIKKSGFTFSNGLHLPYGTWVSTPTFAIHHDARYYEDPSTFDGFRFSKMRDSGEELKHQMVSTNLQYLTFGHGKHACPGRFFAATELKAMLAHILVTYEVRLESQPKPFWLGPNIAPDSKLKVLFRHLKQEC